MNTYSYLMAKDKINDDLYINIDVVRNGITDLHLMMFKNYIYKEDDNIYIYAEDGYNIIEIYIKKYFDNDEAEKLLNYYKYFKNRYLYFVFNLSEVNKHNLLFYSTWIDLFKKGYHETIK